METNKRKHLRAYILVILFILLFVLQLFLNSMIFFAQGEEDLNEIDYYDTVSLYDMNKYVGSAQGENIDTVNNAYQEAKNNVSESVNTNIEINNTQSLLDLKTTNEDVVEINDYIEEESVYLTPGYELKIDDEVFYIDNEEYAKEAYYEILKEISPNLETANTLYNGGTIIPFKEDGRKVIDIEINNEVTLTKKDVPADEIITSEKDLLYAVLHADDTKYDTINEGETLNDVAKRNDITMQELEYNNPDINEETLVYNGQELVVSKINPVFDIAKYYEYSEKEKIKYSTVKKNDPDLKIGTTKIDVKGQNGSKKITYEVKEVNGEEEYNIAIDEEVVKRPVAQVESIGTYEPPGEGTGTIAWPSASHRVTCGWGCYSGHKGIDIQNYYGAPIMAADNGTVVSASYHPEWGNNVLIDHNNGMQTRYAHMSTTPIVSAGTNVEQGQVIGYEGASGTVTGEHLHFEIYINGTRVDPRPYLQ